MRERIILEIQRLAQENGKPPGEGGFESATGIVQREWLGKIWGRWGDALRDAGFEPNDFTKRLATVDVIRACAECCKALGRWPSDPDYHLWMAPALQVKSDELAFGRVQSSVRPVDAVGVDCWP